MLTATITSKDQVPIPKEIQEHLNLRPGDHINFVTEANSRVYIQNLNVSVEKLSGILHKPDKRPNLQS